MVEREKENIMINEEEIYRKLSDYPFIDKHYRPFIKKFIRKKHDLIQLLSNEVEFLVTLDEILKSLDSFNELNSLIKKSRNPKNFWDILSEINVLYLLKDKVENIELGHPSPDFKIKKLNTQITLEVKHISNRIQIGKATCRSIGGIKVYGVAWKPQELIKKRIEESIEKKQYIQGIPHILIFDVAFAELMVDKSDFWDVLYCKEFLGDGLFYKKEDKKNFLYSMISGATSIFSEINFDSEMRPIYNPQIIFFENPNGKHKIDPKIIKKLGFKVFSSDIYS